MSELTCAEMVEIFSDYLEFQVELRELSDEHLAGCEGCEEYLRGLVYAIGAAGQLRATVSPAPMDRLTDLFRRRGEIHGA